MRITFSDLWRPSGTIDRGAYALVGVMGFALKHNLDRFVASYGFQRRWGLFNYWVPVRVLRELRNCMARKHCFWEPWFSSPCHSYG